MKSQTRTGHHRRTIKSNRKLVTEARPNSENGGKQTFDAPDTKKNINSTVANWRHRLSPPNSPPPNSKKRKVQSVKASTIVSKVTSKAKTTSAKSASCAVVSTSTSSVLAKPARRAKRRYEELESASDASGEVEEMAPGGMDDDYDDALEQAAAVLSPLGAPAAAQRNKKNLDIRTGIASPNRTKKPKKRNNSELPGGALDAGRWSGVFIPTFLRYLGGVEKDIWAFKRKDAVHVLQAVWNTVYAGSTDGSMSKIKHLVEIGGAVHEVSVQRATEWRNAIGATRLSVVGDFMDSTGLNTTEARREAADQLLADERYVYLKTKDVVEDGVPAVKRAGRYRGPLIVLTLAQCWIDFEGSVEVSGYIDDDDFPYAALILSATLVHRALWLWANGYISKESYDAALGQKKSGILKVLGPDGKCTKTTNFSKEQWEEISDIHVRDVWSVEQEKLQVIRGDINKAVDQIRNRKPTKCRAGGREADRSDPQTRWEHGGKVLTQVWQQVGLSTLSSLPTSSPPFLLSAHPVSPPPPPSLVLLASLEQVVNLGYRQDSGCLVIAFAKASSHRLHTLRHASTQLASPAALTPLTHVYAGHPVVAVSIVAVSWTSRSRERNDFAATSTPPHSHPLPLYPDPATSTLPRHPPTLLPPPP
ncbi:hypothetical protein EDB85DRAFT_1895155 [Lactarius pseudohatsudake]|nr:hypothetical protein EDB85DRAFT_1895155 [Lactarius pseudohatsudake]